MQESIETVHIWCQEIGIGESVPEKPKGEAEVRHSLTVELWADGSGESVERIVLTEDEYEAAREFIAARRQPGSLIPLSRREQLKSPWAGSSDPHLRDHPDPRTLMGPEEALAALRQRDNLQLGVGLYEARYLFQYYPEFIRGETEDIPGLSEDEQTASRGESRQINNPYEEDYETELLGRVHHYWQTGLLLPRVPWEDDYINDPVKALGLLTAKKPAGRAIQETDPESQAV